MHIHIFITQSFFYSYFFIYKLKSNILFIFQNKINIHSYTYLLGYERRSRKYYR